MKRTKPVVIVGVASAVLAAAVAGADDLRPGAPAAEVSRYSGLVEMAARAGAAGTPLRVEVKDLSFVRGPQPARLAEGPFYVAQLNSGVIDTEVAGKKEHRSTGDFWTVPAGESMTVTFPPHRQAAQLRIVTMTPVEVSPGSEGARKPRN